METNHNTLFGSITNYNVCISIILNCIGHQSMLSDLMIRLLTYLIKGSLDSS